MKIGVDAYYLYAEQIDGIGNYLLRLLLELSKTDKSNTYYLYTPGIFQEEFAESFTKNKNFHLRIIKGNMAGKRRMWLQSPSLRRSIINDEVDMFLGGGEYFPLLLPRKIYIASVIHDVAFKIVPEAISFTNKLFYKIFLPFFIKRADSFFTVSNHSKNEIQKYLNIGQKKVTVVYNGIDVEKYNPGNNKIKKGHLLFVGTLQPRKNLINLLKAYSIISDKIKEKLVIVGAKSWRNSSIKEYVESLPQSTMDKIEFKGYVPGNDLISLYQSAKLFTLLSIHEGFCLPILEAMSSGTAVLTAQHAAIPEVYKSSVEYADPFNPEEIANKILYLLSHEEILKKMENIGIKYSKKYDVKNQAENYINAFNKIANEIKG